MAARRGTVVGVEEIDAILTAAARLFPCSRAHRLTPAQLLQTLWALAPGVVEAGVAALDEVAATAPAALDLGKRRDPSRLPAARPAFSPEVHRVAEVAAAVDGRAYPPVARLLGALVVEGHVLPDGRRPAQAACYRFWPAVRGVRNEWETDGWMDSVAAAAWGGVASVVPRDEVTGRLLEIFCRLHGRVAALVGPEGVGKSSVVTDLAWRIAQGAVAAPVCRLRPVVLAEGNIGDGGSLVEDLAGWLDEPTGESWLPVVDGPTFRLLLEENATALGRLVLAYEGAGRPLLLLTDRPLLEHFGKLWPEARSGVTHVSVEEPPERFTEQVVRGKAAQFRREVGVGVPKAACGAVVDAGKRVLRHRFFPAKAVYLLDDAVGRAVAAGRREVSPEEVREAAAATAGIPISHLDPAGPLLPHLERDLARRVVGQKAAIRAVADRLRVVKGSYDQEPHRPDGVFLFTGPSGVGKTELAEALAEALFGREWRSHLIRKHMSEFSEGVSVTKLISAAPGYEGHATTRTLVDEVREHPASVLLLDEMEKAHPEVHTLFLQIFEEGVLTDARGRTAHFGEVTVVMTANVYEDLERRVGFEKEEVEAHEAFDEEAALLKVFPRELVNRFSDTIRFQPLKERDLVAIARDHLVPNLRMRLARDGVGLTVKAEVCSWLAAQDGSARYGARHLARIFDKAITIPIVTDLYRAGEPHGRRVCVSLCDGRPMVDWA